MLVWLDIGFKSLQRSCISSGNMSKKVSSYTGLHHILYYFIQNRLCSNGTWWLMICYFSIYNLVMHCSLCNLFFCLKPEKHVILQHTIWLEVRSVRCGLHTIGFIKAAHGFTKLHLQNYMAQTPIWCRPILGIYLLILFSFLIFI